MLCQHLLAMGVEVFGNGTDALLLQVVCYGEWEGIEAHVLIVAGSVL